MDHWKSKLAYGAILLWVVAFSIPIILALWPLNPIDVKSITVQTTDGAVIAGEPIHYQLDLVKYTDRPCRVVRQLFNDRIITYAPVDSNAPTGKCLRFGTLKTSPDDIAGEYFMRWTATYHYWWFREVVVVKDSNKFQVVHR
jgi:hypothetical protein